MSVGTSEESVQPEGSAIAAGRARSRLERLCLAVLPVVVAGNVVAACRAHPSVAFEPHVFSASNLALVLGFAAWNAVIFVLWRASGIGVRRQDGSRLAASTVLLSAALSIGMLLLRPVHQWSWYWQPHLAATAISLTVFLVPNALIWLAISGPVYAASRRWSVAAGAAWLVAGTLFAVHVGKYRVLEQHLYAWDYVGLGDLWAVFPLYFGAATAVVLGVGVLGVVGAFVLLWRRTRPCPRSGWRWMPAGAGAAGLAGVLLVAAPVPPAEHYPMWHGLSYDSTLNKCGLGCALTLQLRCLDAFDPPADYTPRHMAAIRREHHTADQLPAGAPQVNVILFMMESLSDPSTYGIETRADPLPFLHSLPERCPVGRLLTPTYAGSTANTEFEVLTGLSRVQPYPRSLGPAYREHVNRPTPSLASVFRRHGCATAVISGSTAGYFNQRRAYPHLGFDEFIALQDREGVPRRFGLVSDEAVVDEVIAWARSHERFFVSVMTEGCHVPYAPRVPADPRFEVLNEELSPAARDYVRRYCTALSYADAALRRLVEHFADDPRPTLIVAYGDHKPSMPLLFEAGLLGEGWPERAYNKYSTPLAVWANYPLPETPRPLEVSANLLGAEIFRLIGVDAPPLTFACAARVRRRFNAVSHLIIDREGTILRPDAVSDADRRLLADYGLVKYDVLVGGRLCLGDPADRSVASHADAVHEGPTLRAP